MSIIASEGGAKRASFEFNFIDAWGYPFSVSEEFQLRNSRKNIQNGLEDSKRVKEIADRQGGARSLFEYGLGNPYGEEYHQDIVYERLVMAQDVGVRFNFIKRYNGRRND